VKYQNCKLPFAPPILSGRCTRRRLFKGLGLVVLGMRASRVLLASEPSVDYAELAAKDIWLHHPLYGDPSFDTFKRYAGNPVCRGKPPLEWPVNCFLFDDPVSSNWYLYVGHYSKDYAIRPSPKDNCTVFRSRDGGQRWEHLGPIFPGEPFTFEGMLFPVGGAPDVTVLYDAGRYHLVYDWATENLPNETQFVPKQWTNGEDVGVAYAYSEHPEGPFQRFPQPIFRSSQQVAEPLLGKYDYFYGPVLIRRKQDWLVLVDIFSNEYLSWGLVGLTAQRPEGPYGPVTLLFSVDNDQYQPPLLEYFPAFVYAGWVYAPATSVGPNRNFQLIRRARVEEAMDPKAWEMFQHGSVWHAEDVENEAAGIWGQTFSGFVDKNKQFQVAFPSLDSNGMGTINLATRPWDKPYADTGFNLSAHKGPSITYVRRLYDDFRLATQFELRGGLTISWGSQCPLGVSISSETIMALHPLSVKPAFGLHLEGGQWRVLGTDKSGKRIVMATGTVTESKQRNLLVERLNDGMTVVKLDGKTLWNGLMAPAKGAIGLLLDKASHVEVHSFSINGRPESGVFSLLCTEALLSAAQHLKGESWTDWQEIESPRFRYGVGAVARNPDSGRAKWNFRGTGFTLWAPRGPLYGQVEVVLDGTLVGRVDLCNPFDTDSEQVFHMDNLRDDFHAVVLQGNTGRLVVDSTDIHVEANRA